jgi:DNA-binding CsgD family transcriptional regulator
MAPETQRNDPDDQTRLGRRIRVVASRVAPPLIVVDLNVRPLGWSSKSAAERVLSDAGPELKNAVRTCCRLGKQAIHLIDDETLLRLIPLEGACGPRVGIQIETFRPRLPFANVAKTYRITKREMEILDLVVNGATNAQISQALYIAQSTVADHIKSIMKKTGTTKRIVLMSKFSRHDDERQAALG